MGNAAIALGAVAAGVNVVAGYPGTPSTELLVTDWFAPVCSGLPLDMRHLGN